MQPRSLQLDDLATLAGTNRIPDVIVVDARHGTGVPPALGSLKRQQTSLGVVIVAPTMDPALLLEAMRAGVNELVADPLTQADLEKAVSRVLGQRAPGEQGKIY